MKKNQKGFTLVELMIVVAIIGILAAVAIPKFAEMLEKSREGATKGNLSAIVSGIALYVSDQQGQSPATLDTASQYTNSQTYPGFVPQYMDSLPGVKATAARKKSAPTAWAAWVSPAGSGVTYATWNGVATVMPATGSGWRYDSSSAPGNNFWVNSTAGDMKSVSTASTYNVYSYSLYGYE